MPQIRIIFWETTISNSIFLQKRSKSSSDSKTALDQTEKAAECYWIEIIYLIYKSIYPSKVSFAK